MLLALLINNSIQLRQKLTYRVSKHPKLDDSLGEFPAYSHTDG